MQEFKQEASVLWLFDRIQPDIQPAHAIHLSSTFRLTLIPHDSHLEIEELTTSHDVQGSF